MVGGEVETGVGTGAETGPATDAVGVIVVPADSAVDGRGIVELLPPHPFIADIKI